MDVVHLNDQNFESEVIQSDRPVLVDFWAEWCGPCKMVGPVIEEIANESDGKFKVAKVNVDEAQQLAAKLSIMAIPTLMIFKGGSVVEQMVGALPKNQIMAQLQPHLG